TSSSRISFSMILESSHCRKAAQLPVSRLTGKVDPSTHVGRNPVNQDFAEFAAPRAQPIPRYRHFQFNSLVFAFPGNSILESAMNVAHVPMVFRGVTCRYCDKPIGLTSPFIRREMAIKHDDAKVQELSSRVFAKRCRSCFKEGIYDLDQITDFQFKDSAV